MTITSKNLLRLKKLTLLLTISLLVSCTAQGNNPDQKRHSIDTMVANVLNELYQKRPSTRQQIKDSVGYAVFSNANINLLLLSASSGYGKTIYNASGRSVYMKMAEAGIGFGLGIKDFRAVFIFHDEATLNKFVQEGWQFGGHADASLKSGEKGGAAAAEAVFDDITIYQLTESGIALQATLKGTKYWQDTSLSNQPSN